MSNKELKAITKEEIFSFILTNRDLVSCEGIGVYLDNNSGNLEMRYLWTDNIGWSKLLDFYFYNGKDDSEETFLLKLEMLWQDRIAKQQRWKEKHFLAQVAQIKESELALYEEIALLFNDIVSELESDSNLVQVLGIHLAEKAFCIAKRVKEIQQLKIQKL